MLFLSYDRLNDFIRIAKKRFDDVFGAQAYTG